MMVKSHVELYEALKGPIGEQAARMIAELVPPARDIATRHDVAAVSAEVRVVSAEVRVEIAEVRGDVAEAKAEVAERMAALEVRLTERMSELVDAMAALESRLMGRLWVMFVPLWAGLYGLIATLIIGR